ncbi:hypothetical protein [Arcobacter sp. s6]|uniref:hypothetical protein n=1 Tax=Arcobacter sp. s6 TaxID=3230363 RepID=UPI00349FE5E5
MFNEINKIQKFCDNQLNYETFIKLSNMQDDSYSLEQFKKFIENPFRYMTSRNEQELFRNILETINSKNYQG